MGHRRRAPVLLGGLAVVASVRLVVVEPVRITSTSMEPTLDAGDRVLVEKLSLLVLEPRRGELVVFPDPVGPGLSVKRVVAIAGDEVAIEDGRLRIDGELVVEDHVDAATVDGVHFGPVVVPAGTVFVMGDNRRDSIDSRSYGPVAVDDLTARVVVDDWWDPFG